MLVKDREMLNIPRIFPITPDALLTKRLYISLIIFTRCLSGNDVFAQSSKGQPVPLFASDKPIRLVINGNITAIRNDRDKQSTYHPVQLEIENNEGALIKMPAKVKTRGHYRKISKFCENPPLLINLSKDASLKGTVMEGQNKLKLVVPCTTNELVIREYLLYKVYNLFTTNSLNVRLTRVILVDSLNRTPVDSITGFLLEPITQAATRNQMVPVDKNGLKPQYLPPSDFHLMAVFQYFAGNTDWSIQYRQNIELASHSVNTPPVPIPYDFDMSGLVGASYARPPEELNLSSVLQRRYRGYCLPSMDALEPVFKLFNEKRAEIEKIYRETTGLSDNYRKRALEYIEDFYRVINNPRKAEKEFTYPCLPEGTGNIVIKGLKED
ncbi:hypothetical protein OI18_00700 [Flavihumibacter solisilvae]|uniref:Uncharacterized protein n=2 Tax=Flavihumibacter solisilvae TaxID=1349421 RepID=A0A0C1J0L7_9BACT|nr:hypothetical protein OI18_00700 [Flavihumibacter solisilvae]